MTTPPTEASRDDTEALAASESLRSALSDQLRLGASDVLSLALHAGRILALHGGSSLLATRISGDLCEAHELAKAALLEGYARGREELVRKRALDRMAVPIVDAGAASYAVFCPFEPDDDIDLSEWADGIVRALRKLGAKRLFAAGAPLAVAKVREAAELVGIDTAPPSSSPTTRMVESAPTWRRFWPFRGGQGKE